LGFPFLISFCLFPICTYLAFFYLLIEETKRQCSIKYNKSKLSYKKLSYKHTHSHTHTYTHTFLQIYFLIQKHTFINTRTKILFYTHPQTHYLANTLLNRSFLNICFLSHLPK
jgi:hypothetical protein